MIYEDITEFAALLPRGKPMIGLDLGEKTIGIAVSDLRRTVATPLLTLRKVKFTVDCEALLNIIAQREICAIVLGLPLNMDGRAGPRVQATKAFARNIGQHSPLPILLWDERLSTVAAERALLEADMSRKRRSRIIDHVAAGVILQGALDRLAYLERDFSHG